MLTKLFISLSNKVLLIHLKQYSKYISCYAEQEILYPAALNHIARIRFTTGPAVKPPSL